MHWTRIWRPCFTGPSSSCQSYSRFWADCSFLFYSHTHSAPECITPSCSSCLDISSLWAYCTLSSQMPKNTGIKVNTKFTIQKKTNLRIFFSLFCNTLDYLISQHVGLFFFKKKSALCLLIRSCWFINFRKIFTLLDYFFRKIPWWIHF